MSTNGIIREVGGLQQIVWWEPLTPNNWFKVSRVSPYASTTTSQSMAMLEKNVSINMNLAWLFLIIEVPDCWEI